MKSIKQRLSASLGIAGLVLIVASACGSVPGNKAASSNATVRPSATPSVSCSHATSDVNTVQLAQPCSSASPSAKASPSASPSASPAPSPSPSASPSATPSVSPSTTPVVLHTVTASCPITGVVLVGGDEVVKCTVSSYNGAAVFIQPEITKGGKYARWDQLSCSKKTCYFHLSGKSVGSFDLKITASADGSEDRIILVKDIGVEESNVFND